MGGIYVAHKVGRGQDDPATRAVSVTQLSADQYNAAMVDENGVAIDLTGSELGYLDIETLGTGAASKAVVLNASGDYTYPATATIVYPSSATLTAQSGSTVNIAGTFQVGGVAVTSSAAELNILDGVTATAAELNKVDQSAADVYADGFLQPRVAQATWDFAVDGGAISAIDLGITIPANSLIVGSVIDVQTTCTSATDAGTGAIHVASAGDIVAAVAIGTGTPWDQGLQVGIPKWTAATMVKTTSAAAITFTIGVEAFTAGKFVVHLFYVPTLVNV